MPAFTDLHNITRAQFDRTMNRTSSQQACDDFIASNTLISRIECAQPSDDALEEFVLGMLTKSAREQVETHLLECLECQARLCETINFIVSIKEVFRRDQTDADTAASSGNRRSEERKPCSSMISIRRAAEPRNTAMSALITDISMSGARVLADHEFVLGTIVQICSGDGHKRGEVRYVLTTGNRHVLGVRFAS